MASWRSYLALCSLQIYGSFCVVSQGYEAKNGPEESGSLGFFTLPPHPFPSLPTPFPPSILTSLYCLPYCWKPVGGRNVILHLKLVHHSIQVYASNNVQECI